MDVARLPRLSVEERLYGLALIWQEASYNFAFFDRVPDLDWDACYREYIPQVIEAERLDAYYDLLSRFTAHLQDGHTYVRAPRALYWSQDRPKLALMNVENCPVVTNVSRSLGSCVPIGSKLLEIDGIEVQEYLSTRVLSAICESTSHRRQDHAVARALLGARDSAVQCVFCTPDGDRIEVRLVRNRRGEADPWLRPHDLPYPWEFMTLDEKWLGGAPFSAFAFRMLAGNVAYVALNSFLDASVASSFEAKLPILKDCSGLILDLRKNHGGSDATGYAIVSHFLQHSTGPIVIQSPKHIASYRASGSYLQDTPDEQVPDLHETASAQLLCHRRRWMHEESWGAVHPAEEVLSLPTVLLTSSETNSAAEDFLWVFQSGGGQAARVGTNTSGSTGQPLGLDLPGGGRAAICTVRMPFPDEVWRAGFEPDIRVEPTIEDVIRNEDRVLEVALRHLCRDGV